MSKGKVIVAMSGGVDSSVAALLLQQQGYQVEGATFRLWAGMEGQPPSGRDLQDARDVCDQLGIPHHAVDFTETFRDKVVDDFVRQYDRGQTPNPCVVCNRNIKFGAFYHWAKERGADYIATGHYATVLYDEALGRHRLRQGSNLQKDQSYVLYSLTPQVLAATLLPLGQYCKDEVRGLALQHKLVIGTKADSQDICFIPDGDYENFLQRYTQRQSSPGLFVDEEGNTLGTHQGIWHYTIGQRKGLGISFGEPMYVTGIDCTSNTVRLGRHEQLMHSRMLVGDVNLIDMDVLDQPKQFDVKIRYSAKPQPALVTPQGDNTVMVEFVQPQRAITPGQSAVLYSDDFVAGGGVILGIG